MVSKDELSKLHQQATETRNAANAAYGVALRNRKTDGDAKDAFEALLKANAVRDRIYELLIKAIVDGVPDRVAGSE